MGKRDPQHTRQITKQSVDALEPRDGPTRAFIRDTTIPGFTVRCTAAGVKTYSLQYRIGGRGGTTKTCTIGEHGRPWTPAAARKRAEELYSLVGRGIDPIEQEKAADASKRAKEAEENELAFAEVAERYLRNAVDGRLAMARDIRNGVERLLVSRFDRKPLTALTRREISSWLEEMKADNGPAANAHKYMRQLLNWAVDKGILETSPIAGMKAPVPTGQRTRFHEMTELLRIWEAACDLEAIGDMAGAFLKIVILTGKRNEEMAGLKWTEIDFSEQRIALGASRTKMRVPHMLPLSSLAIEVLERLRRQTNHRGFVFTTTEGEVGLVGKSAAKGKIDKYVARRVALACDREEIPYEPMGHWVFHDLRRTLSTTLAKHRVSQVVRESLLSHGSGKQKGLAGNYDQWEYFDERRQALEKYADLIREAAAGPNAFPGGREPGRIATQKGRRNDLHARR